MYNKEEYLFTVYNSLYHSPASFHFCNWKTFSKAEKDMFFIPYCSFSIECKKYKLTISPVMI